MFMSCRDMVLLFIAASGRSLLLAVVAIAALAVIRVRNGAVRHLVWTAVLVGMLLMPVLCAVLPPFAVPILSEASQPAPVPIFSTQFEGRMVDVPAQSVAGMAASGRVALEQPLHGDSEPLGNSVRPSSAAGRSAVPETEHVSLVTLPGSTQTPRRSPLFVITPFQGLASLYALVAALLLARLAVGMILVRRLVRRARIINSGEMMIRAIMDHAWACRVSLRESREVLVPITVGSLSPCILVSPDWHSWNSAQKRSVLQHELAHIARNDFLIGLAAQVNCCVFWFHPVSWFLARRLAALAELCCDDAVIAATRTRVDYARHLLAVAAANVESAGRRVRLGVSMARRGEIQRRISAILDTERPLARRLTRRGRVGLTLFALPVMLATAALHVTPRQTAVDEVAARDTDLPAATVPVSSETEPTPEVQSASSPAKPASDDPARDDDEDLVEPAPATTLAGRVVTDDGHGVRSTRVWLRQGNSRREFQFESRLTDEQGRFRFPKIAPGNLTLAVVSREHSFSGFHRQKLLAGHNENLQIVLKRPTRLQLRLSDQASAPVAGAELDWIHWQDETSDQFWLPLELLKREGLTLPHSDEQGLMTIDNLPPDATVTVRVKHPDYVRQIAEMKVVADKRPVPVMLQRGSPLFVEVVVAATGEPAADAYVSVSGIPNALALHDQPVDAQGRFMIRLGDLKHMNVGVSHPTLLARKPYVSYRGWNPTDPIGERLRFELFRRAKVTGRVLDQDQRPLNGVTVILATDRQQTGKAVTDDNGRYEIDCPEGWGELSVHDGRGFYAEPRRTRGVDLSPERVAEADDLFARRVPPLRGVVVLPDGKPAVRAFVTFPGSFPNIFTFADEEGRFELSLNGNLHYSYLAASDRAERRSGGTPVQVDAILHGDELRIELQPEAMLRGKLIGPDGMPRAGIRVQLMAKVDAGNSSTMSRDRAAVTDQMGQFHFAGLSRNRQYRVILFSEELDSDSQVVHKGNAVKWLPLDEDEVEIEVQAKNEAELQIAPVDSRRPPVELECRSWLNAEPPLLASLHGKIVLLNFCDTRSEPSVAELPTLQRAHEAFASKGLVIIGVHANSTTEARLRRLVTEKGLTFSIGIDDSKGTTAARHNISHFPTQILIGRDGRVISTYFKGNLWTAVRNAVLYDEGE
jgi:beta-lactamase regulating signal transducer with metallopeptidase domain